MRPFDVILRHVQAILEPHFAVEQFYGKPPGVLLVGRFRDGGDRETLARDLKPFGYFLQIQPMDDGRWLLEVSPSRIRKPRRYIVNILLFVATFGTTTAAGALQRGANLTRPADWLLGIPFSLSLMGILLCHEMGHFFTSLRHRVRATLPYFIPMPNLFGTFGALIRMESPIPSRRALVDIGAAGPLAGFIVAVPVTIVGLALSPIVPAGTLTKGAVILGDSLLFKALTYLIKGPLGSADVTLHPLALAGWIGLWVTSMNLLPIGQLDGGHVAYALFGKWAIWVGRALFVAILLMGFLWNVYFFWAVLILVFIRFKHPPPIDDATLLTRGRRLLGWALLAVFVITFIPIPIKLV